MKRLLLLILPVLLITASCSKYQKLLKSSDMEAKHNAAVKLYEKKDYYRALQLFEELITVFRGTSKAEQSYYYYAYCTYNVDDYVTAAYHFNTFTTSYPNSKYAEEMQFMYAYCYYQDSPISSLDQTSTLDAIDKFQLFINKYPSSERVAEANRLIDVLRLKLETKAFNNAKQYYRTSNYKAATVAFDNLQKDFPASVFTEEALYLSLRSAWLYAQGSVKSKQEDRYKDALEYYYRLVDKFPQSRYLRESERIYDDVRAELGMTKSASVPTSPQ